MSNQQSEGGIPVLTEIIVTPVYGVDLPERRLASPASAVTPVAPSVPPDAVLATVTVVLDEATLGKIERDVSARVLEQLMGQVDLVLEQRLRQSLGDILQSAVDGLACQLRFGLKQTLEDVVAQAISHEIKKLQNSK